MPFSVTMLAFCNDEQNQNTERVPSSRSAFFRSTSTEYVTILGSCVSVIVEQKGAGGRSGICHYLNANSDTDIRDYSYGNIAINELINRFQNKGISTDDLQARVFGGGNVNGDKGVGREIGRDNIRIAKEILSKNNIEIVEEDTGGKHGREISYVSATKKVTVKSQDPTVSDEINQLFKMIYKLTGNDPSEKSSLYYAELSRIKRNHGINSFSELILKIQKDFKFKQEFISQITNHATEWFRHCDSYLHCAKELLKNDDNKLILSAGCSIGKEAYSLAMILEKSNVKNYSIFGVDIDDISVKTASEAVYPARDIKDIPTEYQLYLKSSVEELALKDEIKSKVNFKRDNLLKPILLTSKYDAIFCQNVLIYFSDTDINKIMNTFYEQLKKGGYLYLNRKDRPLSHKFEHLGGGIYKKV